MSYITTRYPIEGFGERHEQLSQVLRTLHTAGFTNPVAYGEGLSNALISKPESTENIVIECDVPKILEPGFFATRFKTEDFNKKQIVYNARGLMDQQRAGFHPLSGLTFGIGSLDDKENILMQTSGLDDQHILLVASTDGHPYENGINGVLDEQCGTMNKIAMHYDAATASVVTTHHPAWKNDAQHNIFAIPPEADYHEINRSLAYYFKERACGYDLKLKLCAPVPANCTQDLAQSKKRSYTMDIFNAAMKAYEARRADIPECKDAPVHEDRIYDEAAEFMEALCDRHIW